MVLVTILQQLTVSLCVVFYFESIPKDEIQTSCFCQQMQQFRRQMMPRNDKQTLVDNLAGLFALDPKVMKDEVFETLTLVKHNSITSPWIIAW